MWGNSGAGGGLFQEFEYISSPYGLADQISALESEASEFKRREVGHGEDFRPGGSLKKLPHEDGFVEGGTFPYHADPYERAGDQILRYRWMMEARAVSGPFVPSGLADKALGYLNEGPAKPTRALLRNLIGKIRAHLAEDWSDADLDIFVTRGEEWAICFRVDTVDSVPGLVAYMNNFLRCSELVNQNGLTKVVESWNLRPHWDPTNIFSRSAPRGFGETATRPTSACIQKRAPSRPSRGQTRPSMWDVLAQRARSSQIEQYGPADRTRCPSRYNTALDTRAHTGGATSRERVLSRWRTTCRCSSRRGETSCGSRRWTSARP